MSKVSNTDQTVCRCKFKSKTTFPSADSEEMDKMLNNNNNNNNEKIESKKCNNRP